MRLTLLNKRSPLLLFRRQVFWKDNHSFSLFCLFSFSKLREQEQRERAHRLGEPGVKGRPFNGEVQTLLKADRSAKVSLMPSRNVPIKTILPHAKLPIKEHNKYLIRLIAAGTLYIKDEARRLKSAWQHPLTRYSARTLYGWTQNMSYIQRRWNPKHLHCKWSLLFFMGHLRLTSAVTLPVGEIWKTCTDSCVEWSMSADLEIQHQECIYNTRLSVHECAGDGLDCMWINVPSHVLSQQDYCEKTLKKSQSLGAAKM